MIDKKNSLLSICVHQYTSVVGDFQGNFDIIQRQYTETQAGIHIFAECSLSGSPLYSLNTDVDFVECHEHYLKKILDITKSKKDTILTRALCCDGSINTILIKAGKITKMPGDHCVVELNHVRVGVLIGSLIAADLELESLGALIIFSNIPYSAQFFSQLGDICNYAKLNAKPCIHINKFGIQEDLFYPGYSGFINGDGQISCLEMTEGSVSNETFNPVTFEPSSKNDYSTAILSLRQYCAQNQFNGITLGLSGGIDSALSLAIAADAIDAHCIHAVIMPSQHNEHRGMQLAVEYCQKLGVHHHVINIDGVCSKFAEVMSPSLSSLDSGNAYENLQARVRAVILMAFSNQKGLLLLNSGNKTEISLGYCTLYGDMCGGYSVISDLYKTDVYRLAKWRNDNVPELSYCGVEHPIPDYFITRKPTAELRAMQIDEEDLPLGDYYKIDKALQGLIDHSAQDLGTQDMREIRRLFMKSEYKRRQSCIGLKITSSQTRELPIINKFS